jgi:hypothetical protein
MCDFDDGSTDGTSEFIKLNFSQVIETEVSKVISTAETNVNQTNATAISLDDDSHFYLNH